MSTVKKVKYKIFKSLKPKVNDYDKQKHRWIKDPYDDGEVDVFAYEVGDYHNGPRCSICDFGGCEHCNPKVFDDDSCLYLQALNKYHEKKSKIERYNEMAKIVNDYIEKGKILI